MFQHVDIDAFITGLTKQAIQKAFNCPVQDFPKKVLSDMQNRLVTMLARYRTFCAPQSSRGQLILPESLKHLPVFLLGLCKHPSIRENGLSIETGLIDIQQRVFELHLLLSKGVKDTVNAIYPRVFRAYPLHPNDCTLPSLSLF